MRFMITIPTAFFPAKHSLPASLKMIDDINLNSALLYLFLTLILTLAKAVPVDFESSSIVEEPFFNPLTTPVDETEATLGLLDVIV